MICMQDFENPRSCLGYIISGKPLYVSVLAIFTALTTVFTIFVQVPIPATGGYFNFGDAGVIMGALLFGPWVGGFAGGVGSMLGDIITGYSYFAPLTLLAKGLEGFLVGLVANPRAQRGRVGWQDFVGVVPGGAAMILTYFFGEMQFFGGIGAALDELPGNFIQIAGGTAIALAAIVAVRYYLFTNYPLLRSTFFAAPPTSEPARVQPPE